MENTALLFNKFLLALVLVLSSSVSLADKTTIEHYGLLPEFRSFAISPDGKHYAFIQRVDQQDYFVIVDTATNNLVKGVSAGDIKARYVYFATNKHVIFVASETQRRFGYRGQWENSGAIVFSFDTQKMKLLLKGTEEIHPAQSGLGRIVALNVEKQQAYMPAYANSQNPPMNLYRVSLNSGKGRIHARGNSSTIDWFVDEQGNVLAREDYVENKQEHRVYSKISGKWQLIYSQQTAIPAISIQAVSQNGDKLLFVNSNNDNQAIYSMSLLDGAIEGPLFSKQDTDIDHIETDINRKITAIKYSGFKSEYEFVNESDNSYFAALNTMFPMSSISLESATQDKSKIILRVSGAEGAGVYKLLDTEKLQLRNLASEYSNIEKIGALKPIRYKARDGLPIPAIITFPPHIDEHQNLPLIALPHGGPEFYDRLQFNWWAQYLANKGYIVLQPNFRGSTGFGYDFRDAGRGKWGREMQDDVSDGVKAMVEAGYADPDRVCIMGSSYGGYSALAGGAFSPELYRCIIAVNGVSDLPYMLLTEKRDHGSNHWVVGYWQKVIGDSKTEKEKLKSVSPVNFAENFQAPVLLIHGKDDTVVPIKQSKRMHKALKKAKKEVKLVTLKGEDHWLSSSSSRLAALKAIDSFLDKHNPAD